MGALGAVNVAVAIDAATRSLVLPFGPLLIYSLLAPDAATSILVSGPVATSPECRHQWAESTREWGRVCAAYFLGRAAAAVLWSLCIGRAKASEGGSAGSKRFLAFLGLLLASTMWLGVLATTPLGFAGARFLCGATGTLACRAAAISDGSPADTGNRASKQQNSDTTGAKDSTLVRAGAASRLKATHASWVLGSVSGCFLGGCLWTKGPFSLHPALPPCLAVTALSALAFFAHARCRRSRSRSRSRSHGRRSLDDDESDPGVRSSLLRSVHSAGNAAPLDLESGLGDGGNGGSSSAAVPDRYLRACGGRAEKAAAMWEETLRWRRENEVDGVLREPQPNFRLIKECYPHALHGRSRQGEIVCYENPGKMDFGRLYSEGVDPSKMQRHYSFVNDYIWKRVSPGDNDTLMTVLDVGGLSLSTLKGNTVMHRYLAATAEIMQKHYPERQSRIVIVNAPWWFASAYRLATGVLSPNTTAKLVVAGTNFLPKLLEFVDVAQIPKEYGGESPYPLGEAPEEASIVALVNDLANGGSGDIPAFASSSAAAATTAAAAAAARGASHVDSKRPDSVSPPRIGQSERLQNGHSVQATAAPAANGVNGLPRAYEGEARALASGARARVRVRDSDDVGTGGGGGGRSRETGGGGVRSRLSALMGFRRGPPRANLGLENRFTYDQARQMWVLEGGAEPRAPDVSQQEQAIVEAIQAAHYKSGLERMARAQARAAAEDKQRAASWLRLGEAVSGGGPVLLFVAGLYIAWSGLQASLEALLPLWLLSSASRGGLHVPARGVGVCLAFQWLLLGLLHRLTPMRVLSLPAKNPLRAIRIGAGIYISAVLLMHVVPFLGLPPNESVASLSTAVVAAAAAAAATALARSAAGLLLQVALRGVASQEISQALLASAAAIGETAGPCLSTAAVAFATASGTAYPMDATFGLNLVAVVAGVCYIATLPLHISTIGGGNGGALQRLQGLPNGGYSENGGREASGNACGMMAGILEVPFADVGELVEEALLSQAPQDARGAAKRK